MNAPSARPAPDARSVGVGVPAVLLLALWAGLLWFVCASASELPERVATHFDSAGRANGWMSRRAAVIFTGGFGVGLPLFMLALAALTRLLPSGLVNLPHREYWLAPERRGRTAAILFRQMLWLACLVVCLIAAMHYLTIRANRVVPPHLPGDLLVLTLALFLGGLGVWIVRLVRTFSRVPEPNG